MRLAQDIDGAFEGFASTSKLAEEVDGEVGNDNFGIDTIGGDSTLGFSDFCFVSAEFEVDYFEDFEERIVFEVWEFF